MHTIKALIMQCKPHYDNVGLSENSYAEKTVCKRSTLSSSHQTHIIYDNHSSFKSVCVYGWVHMCVYVCYMHIHTCGHVYVEARG